MEGGMAIQQKPPRGMALTQVLMPTLVPMNTSTFGGARTKAFKRDTFTVTPQPIAHEALTMKSVHVPSSRQCRRSRPSVGVAGDRTPHLQT